MVRLPGAPGRWGPPPPSRPLLPERPGQALQHGLGTREIDASIGNALTISQPCQPFAQNLPAGDQMALDHHAEHVLPVVGDLFRNGRADGDLVLVLLAAVAVTAVDQDAAGQPGACRALAGSGDALRVVIGSAHTATQRDMTVRVTGALQRTQPTVGVGRQAAMALGRTAHAAERSLDAAIRAVLEADRERQRGSELA